MHAHRPVRKAVARRTRTRGKSLSARAGTRAATASKGRSTARGKSFSARKTAAPLRKAATRLGGGGTVFQEGPGQKASSGMVPGDPRRLRKKTLTAPSRKAATRPKRPAPRFTGARPTGGTVFQEGPGQKASQGLNPGDPRLRKRKTVTAPSRRPAPRKPTPRKPTARRSFLSR